MTETPPYYGHFERATSSGGYPLADWIFGHRLTDGQHWMEYMLEFLNVLVGFDYELGQGDDCFLGQEGYREGYKRRARYGLRRFVFYDDREKTKDPRDDLALQFLRDELQKNAVSGGVAGNGDSPLTLAKELLRSYSAVEVSRSWFAKSLFPAHEELLFWEALRKGATKWRSRAIDEDVTATKLDEHMELSARNFFARGGEIYYLILSAGTQSHPERRSFIERRLRSLLTEGNPAVGRLARTIDDGWRNVTAVEGEGLPREGQTHYRLGWLPDPECTLYREIASDLETLLRARLDPLETLDLLAHLICFHLLIYIYHRAQPGAHDACRTGECVDWRRPTLLVDCLEGRSPHVRRVSSSLYKELEQLQLQRARGYVEGLVDEWAAEMAGDRSFAQNLVHEAERHFSVRSLHKSNLKGYEADVERLDGSFARGQIDAEQYARDYSSVLTDLLIARFRKQFLGVHRKLARSTGFVLPNRGTSQRYVLGDTLLKAIVLANVPPGRRLEYDSFLERIYERYGLVVGQREARASGLYDRRPINVEYYSDNMNALENKLKNAWLLEEYSDATALVVNGWAE
jgi:hypothetical protein